MNDIETTRTRTAICCACHQQCGLLVEVRDNKVARIRGNKAHPNSRGFACIKGLRAGELHEHSRRIHRPLKRKGKRGAGDWQEISWEQAMDEIAEKTTSLADAYGPETLAYGFGTFHGADWGIGQRFMNLFGSPNTVGQDKICYGPGALGEILTYGYGPSFFSFPVPGRTRCMIVWGLRPAASMPLLWRQILETKRSGATLIVIDPEHIKEARQADLWLQVRPGTDAALALGLLHVLINESLYDEPFVETRTTGFDALRQQVSKFTPAHVETLTGVPTALIEQAARLYARHRPALVHAGNGLCQAGRGSVQTGRALACLIAISGNLGVEGGHILTGPPSDLLANGQAFASDRLAKTQQEKRLGALSFALLGEGYRQLDDVVSRAWQGKKDIINWLSSAHEPTLWRTIISQDPYPLTALVLQHHNPVGASANAALAAEAMKHDNLQLLVVQDMFQTASSSLADYLMPAAHWLEKPFLTMGLGMLGFAGDYVECKPKALEPVAGHHSDYAFWRDMGHRLGQRDDWPDTLEAFWDRCLAPAGLDFQAVSSQPGPLFGPAVTLNTGADEPATASEVTYGTPSGKVELYSSLLENWGSNPLPDFDLPEITTGTSGDYPLILTTGGRHIEGFHQAAQLMPWFRRKHPEPRISVHPETGRHANIEDGDWVWLETASGRVRQRVRFTDDLATDVVHADRWWYPEKADDADDRFGWRTSNINVCTDGAVENCDVILGTWLLRGLPCRITRDTKQ